MLIVKQLGRYGNCNYKQHMRGVYIIIADILWYDLH